MIKLLRFTLFVFIVTLCGQFAVVNAQDEKKDKVAVFRGKLFRSDTSKPIANARVMLLDDKKSEKQNNSQETRTGTDGSFTFDKVVAGKYTISMQVAYDNEEDVPCQLLLGKIKGEKDSAILVVTEGSKKIYQVFIKGFSVKPKKDVTKEYDLVCVSAFGG